MDQLGPVSMKYARPSPEPRIWHDSTMASNAQQPQHSVALIVAARGQVQLVAAKIQGNRHRNCASETQVRMNASRSPPMPEVKGFGPGLVQDFHRISEFMMGDADRVIFRRFPKANLYNLLYLQHRLCSLSQEVEVLAVEGDDVKLQGLLPNLSTTLETYHRAILSYHSITKMTRPSEKLVNMLRASAPENIVELKYQLDPQDGWSELVALEESEMGWARKVMENHQWLQNRFRKHTPGVVSSIFTYPAAYVDRAEDILLNVAFCLLVIAPVCILAYLESMPLKLVVTFLFICLMSVVASFLSNLVQKTSLALMAAYTALLVVFLSNNIGG